MSLNALETNSYKKLMGNKRQKLQERRKFTNILHSLNRSAQSTTRFDRATAFYLDTAVECRTIGTVVVLVRT